MTVVRVKGFKIFKDRHGRLRCYHRNTGERIDLSKAPVGSAEFMAECARITALATATAPKPGTLGLLIAAYRGHEAFLDLAPRTRSDYQAVFNYMKPISDTLLIRFDKPLNAILFHYTHDILQSPLAVRNILSQASPNALVSIAGMKNFPWWTGPLLLLSFFKNYAWNGNPRGQWKPWRLISAELSDFHWQSTHWGMGYMASGKKR